MKWMGMMKRDEGAPWAGPMFLSRPEMAVLSQQVCTTISIPACIRAALIPAEPARSSRDGDSPFQITLKGGLVMGGLGAELIFRGPAKLSRGRHGLTTKATLLPSGQTVDVYGRSTQGRVGEDPAVWVQVRDGEALTDPVYVGRLGRGPCLMDSAFTCKVAAETYISPVGISSPSESDLTLTGEMTFDRGLSLRVSLRRREGPLWWGKRPDAEFDFEILPPGHMIHFPAQPIWTGDAAGTLRSLVFLNGQGEPIGDEHLLRPTIALQ